MTAKQFSSSFRAKRSEVEESCCVTLKLPRRDPSTPLGMTSLRTTSLLLFLALASLARADDVVPKRPEFVLYQGMLNRSPFAVATAVAVPVAAPDFARDLYVANAGRTE